MEFTLSFDGELAHDHQIDFYDAAQALLGFQRTLALTTHLIVNGEIIVQAPSLKNAQILSNGFEAGSWKSVAVVMGTVFLSGGVASQDSVLGHLFVSGYDYIFKEVMGEHVDFDATIGKQIDDIRRRSDNLPRELDKGKFEALVEKCEPSIKQMHRPISHSKTAENAVVGRSKNGIIQKQIGPKLDSETYDFIAVTNLSEKEEAITGKVSSYNTNTYKGRIYVEAEGRPIPFELAETARDVITIRKIVTSLSINAARRFDADAEIKFNAFAYLSRTGRLKGYLITDVK